MKRRADGRKCQTLVVDGKKHYFYGRSQTEINAKIVDFFTSGEHTKQASPLFSEVVDDYMRAASLSPNTSRQYGYQAKWAKEQFKGLEISEIDRKAVSKTLKDLEDGRTAKTVREYKIFLSLVFKHAISEGIIDTDPTEGIQVSGKESSKRRRLTEDEIAIINNHRDSEYSGFLWFFILHTGLRKGERLAIDWSDIDMISDMISVSKSLYWDPDPKIKKPKTKAGIRTVVIDPVLKKQLSEITIKDGHLFSYDGDYYHRKRTETHWIRFKDSVGLPADISPHSLRHTYRSMLHDKGVDVKTAQYLLGHASIQTTMNIYTHVTQKSLEAAKELLNK